jgi:hypothetical protein
MWFREYIAVKFSFMSSYLYSLFLAVSSFIIAFGSLFQINFSEKISFQRGIFLITCGFIYFISLTTFFNKLILETRRGLSFIKKYKIIRISDILDISNK